MEFIAAFLHYLYAHHRVTPQFYCIPFLKKKNLRMKFQHIVTMHIFTCF